MPPTFLDAVIVARRLGFRYPWIDALYIVQPSAGDDSDWLEEGSRMGVIYQNAACTIAATAALHANQGFLKQTGSRHFMAKPVTMCKAENGVESDVYIPVMVPWFYESISQSALNTRGWVIQERALSTRTLHFQAHGLFWECGSYKAHAVYGTLQNRDDFPSCRSRENLLSVARTKRTRHVCLVEWFKFVKHYSRTNFTNSQDRLLALSSVAEAVQPYLGGHEYVTGLWRDDVLRGLAWKCISPGSKETDPLTTPSWSWAAAEGGIDFGVFALRMYRYDLVSVLDVSVTPVLASIPFGRVKDGSLILLGKLMPMWLPKAQEKVDLDLRIYWDDPLDETCPNPNAKYHLKHDLLPICMEKRLIMNQTDVGALILESTGRAEFVETETGVRFRSEFRRMGWIEFAYRKMEKGEWWQEREVEDTVLV